MERAKQVCAARSFLNGDSSSLDVVDDASSTVYVTFVSKTFFSPTPDKNVVEYSNSNQLATSSSSNGSSSLLYVATGELYERLRHTVGYVKMVKDRKSPLYKRTRRLPLGSFVALLVSWIGLALFCTKTYNGADEIENLSKDLFAFLIPWIEKLKLGIIILGICMACITLAMTFVGFMATQHCHCSYKNKTPHSCSCACSKFGGRFACALFWLLSYLLNLCWLGILSVTVVMTAAYLAFLPVCLPQAGREADFCFNFTLFSLMISGGKDANAVSLILCGGPIDKFCKLSKAVMPWFWGSYFGCIAVLMGLSHFNATLSANFAHGKHAIRYVKLRRTAKLPSYKTDIIPKENGAFSTKCQSCSHHDEGVGCDKEKCDTNV